MPSANSWVSIRSSMSCGPCPIRLFFLYDNRHSYRTFRCNLRSRLKRKLGRFETYRLGNRRSGRLGRYIGNFCTVFNFGLYVICSDDARARNNLSYAIRLQGRPGNLRAAGARLELELADGSRQSTSISFGRRRLTSSFTTREIGRAHV